MTIETKERMQTRRVLRPEFADTIAREGISISEFAKVAGVERGTIYALLNPSQHPNRKGGMLRMTAWKLAKAYAKVKGISDDDAYVALIAEEQS